MTKIEQIVKNILEGEYLWLVTEKDGHAAALDDAFRTIARHYWDLKQRPPAIDSVFKGLSANATLKRLCYQLTELHIRDESFHVINEICDRHITSKRGRPRPKDNPFKICLGAIFAHHPSALHPRDKVRFGDEMMLAYRHFIPANDLERFNRFCSAEAVSGGLAPNEIEPLFADYVAIKLALSDHHEEMRGDYSDQMLQESRKISDYARQKQERLVEHELTADGKKRRKRSGKNKKNKGYGLGWA